MQHLIIGPNKKYLLHRYKVFLINRSGKDIPIPSINNIFQCLPIYLLSKCLCLIYTFHLFIPFHVEPNLFSFILFKTGEETKTQRLLAIDSFILHFLFGQVFSAFIARIERVTFPFKIQNIFIKILLGDLYSII